MKKRKLGDSNLFISEIGLGCMSLGTDDQKATKLFPLHLMKESIILIRLIYMILE